MSDAPAWRGRVEAWARDTALNLAVLRVTVAAVILGAQDVHALAVQATRIPVSLRTPPLGWQWAMRAFPIDVATAETLRAALTVAAVTGLVGLFSRASWLVVTIAGALLWGEAQTIGTSVHMHHLLWFSALLAASPCGDALSVDRVIARRGWAQPPPSLAYGVPIRATWLLLGMVYFFPGLWKLLTSGPAWIISDNLLHHMHAKWTEMADFTPLVRIDRAPWLVRLGALTVVLFELLFLPMVMARRTRAAAVVTALVFHQLTAYLMGLRYPTLWCCHTVFVDWTALAARWRPVPVDATPAPPLRPVTAWTAAALLAGALCFGAAGQSDGWPFACYPKFDRLQGDTLPAMEVELTYADRTAEVPVRAMFPLGRTQRYWAFTWSLVGAHLTERATPARFATFWRDVSRYPGVRAMLPGARTVRFYRATISTIPERRDAPPLRRVLLAEFGLTPRSR